MALSTVSDLSVCHFWCDFDPGFSSIGRMDETLCVTGIIRKRECPANVQINEIKLPNGPIHFFDRAPCDPAILGVFEVTLSANIAA